VCATGYGIRRSKDLRAEIGKCPISTNERKNMSTKTLRKRIALVAVATLGAGVLSVAPANAAVGDLAVSTSNGSKGILTAPDNSTTGVMTSDGYLSVTALAALSGDNVVVKVTGGTIQGLGAATTVSGGTIAYIAGTTALEARIFPSAAGTNITIKSYDDTDGNYATTNTLNDTWTVQVIAPGLSGVASASYHRINVVDSGSTTYTGTTDTLYASSVSNGNEGLINIKLYDGLGSALTTDLETVSASVKSGDCLVGGTGAQTLKFYPVTTSSGTGQVFTVQNTEDAPTVCVVEVSVNGVVVATKSITHQGAVKTIEVSSVEIADSGASAQTGLGYVVAKDSAGNSLGYVAIAEGTGANASVSTLTFTNSNKTGSGSTSVNSGAAASSVPTSFGWTCSGVKGSATMTIKHTPSNGIAIHSAPFTAACNGDAVNYKASFDKATYVPGDIATLTITATDSAGAAANDQEAIGTATTYEVAIAGSNMTAVSAATNADTFTAGKKTYKFIVGSTEGSYQLSVDLPKFNSTTYSQSAITVPYSIKASSSAVSNADVLKAIVSLIASINKQIAALQKALLKK